MVVIVKYGEIALKGQNRSLFEKRLVRNIKDCLKKNDVEFKDIKREVGRIIINTKDKCKCLKYVFGIASFTKAKEISLDNINEEALKQYTKGTFRISVKRVDKVLKASYEIEREVGAYIVEKKNAKVDLKNPDVNIQLEIFKDKAFVYSQKESGLKGLPVGIEGLVAVLLEDKDSIEAAKLMMKRGCLIILIKVNDVDFKELKKYEYGFKIIVMDEVPEYALTVVTSEKLDNLKDRNFKVPVLRPLIAS